MNSFIFENPQVNFCSPRSAADSLMNKSDIRGWFRKIKLITRILITLLHFIFHACARTSPAVSRQQTVVLTICHFTECLLTTVKHKLISQICEHIAVPMTTKLLASVIILFHYSRHRFTIHCSPTCQFYFTKTMIISCPGALTMAIVGTLSLTLED